VKRSLVLSLYFALAASSAFAQPRIQNLTAIAAEGRVSVHLELVDAFRHQKTVQALQSGLPTSFTYIVEIYRDRPNWFDEGIARSHVEVIATFNSVTREYLLNYRRDRKLVRSETLTDLDALEKRMTVIDEPNLFEIGSQRPYKLKVRVKADFERAFLLYVVPWQISTHWRTSRVSSAPEAKP
jgi:Domain of unknown function (DUF4390)